MKARHLLTLGTFLMAFLGSTFGATPVAALPTIETLALQVCHFPSVTAQNVALITPDDPVGTSNCPLLCDKWVVACKGAVDISKSCMSRSVAKAATVQAAVCNVQSGAARDACNDQLKADKASLKAQFDASRDSGIAYCETTGLSTCLANCN